MKKFNNVYFINGTAYAGKSTMVKMLAKKYNGIVCEENYHDVKLPELDSDEFPGLTYTRDLKDWGDFIRRTPDEYEKWINVVTKECTILELQILEELSKQAKPVFVDTNIPVEVLAKISDKEHVLIMLAEPEISVNRFFERPDKEKQFLYRLLLEEENPDKAMDNFRKCLMRVNSEEIYSKFLNSGFNVIKRDDTRTIEETFMLVEEAFSLKEFIGKKVTVKIDRPMGSYHPKHKDIYYPINYGYIEGIMAQDGEEQDAYVLGVNEPVEEFTGVIIAIIHRYDDVEEKWVVAPEGVRFTVEEIEKQVHFQEQYFNSEIRM